MILITENFRYYKYTEITIDTCLQIFLNRSLTKRFLSYNEIFKDYLMKFYNWFKKNPISPQYINTKETVMFKNKKNPGNNLSETEIKQCNYIN
jgi:hypothetical protein